MAKKQILKVFSCLALVMVMMNSLLACSNKLARNDRLDLSQYKTNIRPDIEINTNNTYGLDFVQLHNYVIDGLMSEYTPFFYVVNNSVVISGDNDKKEISLACVVDDKTLLDDLDLFLSMALRLIGEGAAEQDFKYKAPKTDMYDEYTYTSFGTVFDTYNLSFDCKRQNGDILRNDYIKAGTKIPIDPRFWRE